MRTSKKILMNYFLSYTRQVAKHGRLVFGVNDNGIGPGGYIASGGYGPLSPTFGLAVDNVLEIKVVLADGRLATCTENQTVIDNPDGTRQHHNTGDLFWALRGGGGATYGVVVHYVLKLHPAPTAIGEASINVQLSRNESDDQLVKRFFDAFDGWERNSPYYWGGSIFFRPGGLSATLKKYGPIDEKSESELKPFYDLQTLYPDPAKVTINLVNLTSYMAGGSWRFGFYTAGALIPPEKHNDGLWEFLKQEVVMSKSNGHIFCFLNRLGGKTTEYSQASSSVHLGYRRAQSYVSCALFASNNNDWEMQEQQRTTVARFAEKIQEFSDGVHVHSSYISSYIPSHDWKNDFWGDNYVDLLKVKVKYDPNNLFFCYHCVGSDRIENKSSRATTTVRNLCVWFILVAKIAKHYVFE